MACFLFNNCYLPQPARVWSRVQNSCSLISDSENNGFIKVPYTNELVPAAVLGEKMAMLNKGNVLQYKANSSNLTKAQRYSKIAQGKWINRNTTWATQSTRGYTNPNTTSLKRSGNVVNIAFDPITGARIGPTTVPVTCPQPINPIYPAIPINGGGGDVNDPNIPPPVQPLPGSNVFPENIPDAPVEPIVIQDDGVLICSVQENICTGETKRTLSQQLCNPTSDSDVPGPLQELCWNDGTPTWYPRQRYTMSNSTDKWPYNYKFLVPAYPKYPPYLLPLDSDYTTIDISINSPYYKCIEYYIVNYEPVALVIPPIIDTITSTETTATITWESENYEYITDYIITIEVVGYVERPVIDSITASDTSATIIWDAGDSYEYITDFIISYSVVPPPIIDNITSTQTTATITWESQDYEDVTNYIIKCQPVALVIPPIIIEPISTTLTSATITWESENYEYISDFIISYSVMPLVII